MTNLRSLSSPSSYLFTLCFKTGNFLVTFKFLFLQNFVIKLQSSGLVFRFGERIFFGLKDISGKAALRKDFLLKQLIFLAADERASFLNWQVTLHLFFGTPWKQQYLQHHVTCRYLQKPSHFAPFFLHGFHHRA